jgi:hypothetical protein
MAGVVSFTHLWFGCALNKVARRTSGSFTSSARGVGVGLAQNSAATLSKLKLRFVHLDGNGSRPLKNSAR